MGNHVENAGRHGIQLNSGERNVISGNTVLNSADDVPGTDGIRLDTSSGIACNDNVVEFNTATDDQVVKTQCYGLNIASPDCQRTVVRDNDFIGNLVGAVNDTATDTIYVDTIPPTAPANLQATDVQATSVSLRWDAATDPADNGVVGYDIDRPDGTPLASVGLVTSYRDTTVDPATAYTYVVRARRRRQRLPAVEHAGAGDARSNRRDRGGGRG